MVLRKDTPDNRYLLGFEDGIRWARSLIHAQNADGGEREID